MRVKREPQWRQLQADRGQGVTGTGIEVATLSRNRHSCTYLHPKEVLRHRFRESYPRYGMIPLFGCMDCRAAAGSELAMIVTLAVGPSIRELCHANCGLLRTL